MSAARATNGGGGPSAGCARCGSSRTPSARPARRCPERSTGPAFATASRDRRTWSSSVAATPAEGGVQARAAISAVDRRHDPFGVAGTCDLSRRKRLVERAHFRGIEANRLGRDVLFEISPPLRPGNRDDVVALVQEPGERDLAGLRAFDRRDLADDPRGLDVGVEILALVARIDPAIIAFRIILRALCVAGQEAPPERRKGHEADSEFT